MIIDCHGHYTTAPKALEEWRNRQIAGIKDAALMPKASELHIGDDANAIDLYFADADAASRWLRDALAAVANARTGR